MKRLVVYKELSQPLLEILRKRFDVVYFKALGIIGMWRIGRSRTTCSMRNERRLPSMFRAPLGETYTIYLEPRCYGVQTRPKF